MWVPLHPNSCFTFLDTVNTGPTEPPTTCPDLTVPANGVIIYNMGTASLRPVDTVATYTCVTGYTLNGGSTRTCGSDGVWSESAPTCQRKGYWVSQLFSSWMYTYSHTEITCSDLVLPTLMVSYNGGSPGNRPVDTGATYSCNNGYTLIGGDITRVCVNGGSWSGSTPTCQGELCTHSTAWIHWFNSCRTHWTTHHLSWPHRTNQWSDHLQSSYHSQTRGNHGHTDLLEWIRTLRYQH